MEKEARRWHCFKPWRSPHWDDAGDCCLNLSDDVLLEQKEAISVSYPQFFADLERLI